MPFVHLHTHSTYSLKEGAARVEDLAERTAAMGMEALALTDHDGMYGSVRFTLACKAHGIRPILGAEIEWGEGYHAVLLAMNEVGWSNLCRLVTEMHLGVSGGTAPDIQKASGDTQGDRSSRAQSLPPGKRPRTSFEEIARHSEGLFALSGCDRGEVGWLVATGRTGEAEAAARRWLDVFGAGRFAIEVHNHLLEQDGARNRLLWELEVRLGVRTVATNNVHYLEPRDAVLHDVLDCMRRIVPLVRSTSPRGNSEFYLKTPKQMEELHPPEALAATEWIAGQCAYELPLGKFHFPKLSPERGGPDPDRGGESATSILARRCYEGLGRRYPVIERRAVERLQHELRTIRRMGFCGYFLLVADIVDHAKRTLGIRCACRGSAAGSLVAYALGISDVDPVRYDLAFERFMNQHRVEIPDIDIDFESARREEVLAYILGTYGERAAMVSMMDTFRARGALREVGKALGLPEGEIDEVAKAFPHISAGRIHEALDALPELAGLNLTKSRLDVLFDLASRIDGFPRHLALHPSAVILSDERLADLMPMQTSFGGFLMSQYDKDDVEALGIAKLDVLGVRMLSAMAHTLGEVERVRGCRVDIDAVPRDDPETFELIRDSRTLGCFQIESPGQRELLGKFQPGRFEDLITDISLFRPGPVKSDMVRPFLDRRHGFEPVTYLHPALRPILEETNGVIVYHEQVMRVISALVGCDLAASDGIRRSLGGGLGDEDAMNPGHPDPQLRSWILDRAESRGWDRAVAGKVWAGVEQFAAFGFCKAHAAAFALPTYQSAWLKAHFPAEFYCGVLTHDPGMYPRRAILADARAQGVPILPVDVNLSSKEYRVEPVEDVSPPLGMGIRLALKDVKGISDDEITSIVGGGPWKSFEGFCRSSGVSRPVIESLIHCGGFDGIKKKRSRRELYWAIETIRTSRPDDPGGADQLELDLSVAEQIELPGITDYSDRERVEAELEVLGLDASRHVLSFYRERLIALGWTPACELRRMRSQSTVVVAGVKVATQTPPVRSGKRVIFLTLEDGTGQADIALFEEAQRKYARRVFNGWILAVKGKVRRTGAKGVSILGEDVIDLGQEAQRGRKVWHSSSGSAGR